MVEQAGSVRQSQNNEVAGTQTQIAPALAESLERGNRPARLLGIKVLHAFEEFANGLRRRRLHQTLPGKVASLGCDSQCKASPPRTWPEPSGGISSASSRHRALGPS